MLHRDSQGEVRAAAQLWQPPHVSSRWRALGGGIVRLSIGLEHVEDLAEDILAALDAARA
jgi:cystathionine beta-lyase/cystathionine gamma-synthase